MFLHFDVGGKVARGRRGGRLLLFRHGRSLNFLQYGPKRPKKFWHSSCAFVPRLQHAQASRRRPRELPRDCLDCLGKHPGMDSLVQIHVCYHKKRWVALHLFLLGLCLIDAVRCTKAWNDETHTHNHNTTEKVSFKHITPTRQKGDNSHSEH